MIVRKLTAYVLVLLLTTTAFTLFSLSGEAQESSADAYGYYWTDSNSPDPTVTFDWIDISLTGTDVGFYDADDSSYGPAPIGFDFPFYANVYNSLYICTNGFVSFGSATTAYSNQPIPVDDFTDNIVAPYWDDLSVYELPYNSGAVYFETMGVAPERQFVVQWDEITHLSDYDLMTFELILNETGEIWFQYLSMNAMDGSSATVGIESFEGAYGCQYSYNEQTINDSLAIMFELGPLGFGPDSYYYGDPGESVDYLLTIRNGGSTTESYDIEVTSSLLGWTVELFDASYVSLTDHNGNTIPDTGDIAPGGFYQIRANVTIPAAPTALVEITVITATAYSTPSISDTVTLTTESAFITLTPPYMDYGDDTDSDGDFDYLVFEIYMESFDSAYAYFEAYLETSLNDSVSDYDSLEWLTTGSCVVQLYFAGEDLFMEGFNGTYQFEVRIFDEDDNLMAVVFDNSSFYNYDEFQPPDAIISSPITEAVPDADSDLLYDSLDIFVPVIVYEPGYYYLDAYLYTSTWNYVTYVEVGWNSSGEDYEILMSFPGYVINGYGFDGTYLVELVLRGYYGELFYMYYTTASYSNEEFEPAAYFITPHNETTPDDDADLLYDSLDISIGIDINEPDDYYAYGYLYDYYGSYIMDFYDTGYWTAGVHTVEVTVPGWMLRDGGYDSPYEFVIYLLDSSWYTVDSYSSYTDTYVSDGFDTASSLAPPYSDFGLDENYDGCFDLLVVEVPVTINSTGEYTIWAYLLDESEYYIIDSFSYADTFDVGAHMFDVYFDGITIRDSGFDGPYVVYISLYDTAWGLMDSDTYTTGSYSNDEFQPFPSSFIDFWDYGMDVDSDWYYDYLIVVAEVDVTIAGEYTVVGSLYDPYMDLVDVVENTTYLDVGIHEVELWYDGAEIRATGNSGYYRSDTYLYNESMFVVDSYMYSTNYIYIYDYEPLGQFSPPHFDYGYDQNGDGSYEYLVLETNVEVSISGDYTVIVYLYDVYYNYMFTVEATSYCEEGVSSISVYVPGWDILGDYADGPYYADLYLYYDGAYVDYDYYTTSDYSYGDFAPIPALFDWPHSDYAFDADGDDLYEQLVIVASVDVAAAGDYVINMELRSYYSEFIDEITVEVYLMEGLQSVEVAFDSWVLAALGYYGPYYAFMYLLTDTDIYLDYAIHETDYYDVSEFDATVPLIYSYWAWDAPTVDGTFSPNEWDGADVISLLDVDSENALDTLMFVLNNGTHLFVCFDVIGDVTEDDSDISMIAFDTLNDGVLTTGHEDEFGVYGTGDTIHMVYSYSDYWSTHCSPFNTLSPDHESLAAAAGFGASDNSESEHRVYEFCIPLDLIVASPGDVLGFVGGVGDGEYDAVSVWPLLIDEIAILALYGDVALYSSAPPTTTATLSGTELSNGWYSSDVEVTLDAVDDDEGVNYTMYRLDGGAWTEYTEPVTVSGERAHTFEFYSVDLAGNEENVRTVSVNIDAQDPTVSATLSGTLGNNDWYTTSVRLTLSGSDGTLGSGVAVMKYRLDGGTWTNYTGQMTFDEEGSHTVEFYAIDVAGNEGVTEEVTFKVDTVAPVTSSTVDGSTVTLSATDVTSGINVTYYRIDGGDWAVYTGAFEVEGSGNHTVEFYSVDNAGNAGETVTEMVEGSSGIFGMDTTVFFILMALIALIVAVLVVLMLVMRKRSRGSGPAQFQDSPIPPSEVEATYPQMGPDQELPPPPEQ